MLDAQYWGVPQRRKRIYLIGSFGSDSAAEILFEYDSVQRYLAPRKEQAQGAPSALEKGAGGASYGVDCYNGSVSKRATALGTNCGKSTGRTAIVSENSLCYNARGSGDGATSPTVTGDHNSRVTDYTPFVVQPEYCVATQQGGAEITDGKISPTLTAAAGMSGNNQPWILAQNSAYAIGNGQAAQTGLHELTYALDCMHDQQAVIYTIDRAAFNQGENALYEPRISDDGINSTLVAKGPGAVAYGIDCRNCKENEELFPTLQAKGNGGISLNFYGAVMYKLYLTLKWIVRRLTPKECERLQGYPDDWTVLSKYVEMSDEDYEFYKAAFLLDKSIKGKSVTKEPDKKQIIRWHNGLDNDGARYRMLGNSLAIPCALRVIGYIADYERRNNNG